MSSQIITVEEVAKLTRSTKPTIYRWRKDERLGFPRPVKLGNKVYWYEHEIREWIEERRV